MRFPRTRLATDWHADESRLRGIVRRVLTRGLPEANPDYRLDLVRECWVEFDADGMPNREIGLGEDGSPVLAGPDDRNYGFWLDTIMRFDNFTGEQVDAAEFEDMWRLWLDSSGRGTTTA
jgi:hypothetical protein